MADIQYYGTGRRKTSTARVYLRPGSGAIIVNRREFENISESGIADDHPPAASLTETIGKFDILVNVDAAERPDKPVQFATHHACFDGIQRGPSSTLKKAGLVTRDPSEERKKYGQKGARKRFQFSKR